MKKQSTSYFLTISLVGLLMLLGVDRVQAAAEIGVTQGATTIVHNSTNTDFGTIDLGLNPTGTVTRDFTVSETGDAPLTWSLSTGSLSGTGFSVSAAGSTIADGGSAVTFTVTFDPAGAVGTYSGTLDIISDGSVTPFKVKLSGASVGPEISITGIADGGESTLPQVDLGTATVSSSTVYTINNTGGGTLNISSITDGDTDFEATGLTSTSIAGGGTATFQVNFSPATRGDKTATLTISSNAPSPADTYTIDLKGKAVAPVISLNAPTSTLVDPSTPASFGVVSVGTTKNLNFTIENTGDSQMTINGSVTKTGNQFTIKSQPDTSLAPGESSLFTVQFTPDANGVVNGTLTIPSNVPGASSYVVNLTGTGGSQPNTEDAFGYTMAEAAPAAAGSFLSSGDDDVFVPADLLGDDQFLEVDLGFPFFFYEKSYTKCFIATNGLISFGSGSRRFNPNAIPSTSPNNFIAPFWTDLGTGSDFGNGKIIYATRGIAPNRVFIVKWENAAEYGKTTNKVTFQALLYENTNAIEFQYKDIGPNNGDDWGHDVTIGIESRDYGVTQPQPAGGVVGIQYANGPVGTATSVFNTSVRAFPAAVRFTRPVIFSVESKYEQPTIDPAVTVTTDTPNLGGSDDSILPNVGTTYRTPFGTDQRFEAPEVIYLNRNFEKLAMVGDLDDSDALAADPSGDYVAWYRLVNDGYAIDGQVVQGTHAFFTTTLTHDVTVIWRWRLEYAVIIDSATGGGGFGNPVPEVGRQWYRLGEQVTASIDSSVENPGEGFRFRSQGYSVYGKNGDEISVVDTFDEDATRQATTPFTVTEPRRIKWEWTGQVRYRVSAALAGEQGMFLDSQAFVKVFNADDSDPGPGGIVWANGEETDVWIDSGSTTGRKVEVGIFYRTNDRCYTLSDFNTPPGGDLGSLGLSVSGLSERLMDDLGGNARIARFYTVDHAENPTTLNWNYSPTVYRAIVPLGQSFDATNPDIYLVPKLCDGAVLAANGGGPGDAFTVLGPPDESLNKSAEPLQWDSLGKQLFPVHPGSYRVEWPDVDGERSHRIEIVSGFPGEPAILSSPLEVDNGARVNYPNYQTAVTMADIDPTVGYPAAADNAHYRHLYAPEDRRPPTKLDLNEADQWKFLEMTFAEETTNASVQKSIDGVPFEADGPGKTVLLYSYRPNPNEIADDNLAEQNLAVRIVKSSEVNSVLRDDSAYVLGRRGLVLGYGEESENGAIGMIERAGGPASITPGDHYVIDFWLNAKGLTAPQENSLTSCETTSGSTTVVCSDTGKLEAGMNISGTNIPADTTIVSITNATTFELSAPALDSGSELSLSAIDRRPVTIIDTGADGLVVTLDAAASTVTATYGDVDASVTHALPKAGASWRHFVIHLFESRFFNSPVTILDFYLDGIRSENGALGHLLTGAAPINVASSLTAESLRLGEGVDPEDGIQFDQLRLFSLVGDNDGNPWLTAGEVRQLRMDAVSPLRTVVPQLNFGFESLPDDGTFVNGTPGVNVGIGSVSNDEEELLSGLWARLDIEEVATRLDSTLDNAGFSGGGYVLNPVSNYNADLHVRDAEIGTWGPVFPVNDGQLFTAPENRLEIAYYENPFLTEPQVHPNVAWPYISAAIDNVTYPVFGPHKDKAIYIASRVGSEGVDQNGRQQQIYNLDEYANLKVYNQPSKDLAGYNPNEEHALTAPSGRAALKLKNVGAEIANNPPMAAFALQENINESGSTFTSDPWVLVQVENLETGEPEMSAYRVFETRAGSIPFPRPADVTDTSVPGKTILGVDTIPGLAYEPAPNEEDRFLTLDPDESYDFNYQFAFPVFAGDLLIPPYPLNVVIGNVPSRETRGGNMDVDGAAQLTYWTDVNGNAWVVSGNGRFFQQFFYPMRPDFYLPEVGVGNPVPWVPVEKNGDHDFTGNAADLEPGRVIYSSRWRSDYPKLKRGETLTYQGGEYFNENPGSNGLPALVAMKAAEVVYDDSTKDMIFTDEADLKRYSARIIRPLDRIEERFTVAQMASAGFSPASSSIFVVAERWYFRDLPGSLQKRFYFDSLAQKLVFRGYLNDKDSGDPDLTAGPDPLNVLEPNVITTADRDRMLPLGAGEWPAAVEKIFAKSQNPMLIRDPNTAGNPKITGKYLAGMKESPVLTNKLGLDTDLLGLGADLVDEQEKLDQLVADLKIRNTQWVSVLSLEPSFVTGIVTKVFSLLNGLVIFSSEEIASNRNALVFANKKLSDLNSEISTLRAVIEPRASQKVSNYVHLDSFGVGSALVCNPGLLTAPVDGSRYITIAENNRSELDGAAISLHIVEIIPDRYRGAVKVIEAADAFSEKVTLQHNGDFGANTDDLYYEWWIRDAAPLNLALKREIDSLSTATPDPDWQQYLPEPAVPKTAAELAALGVNAEDGKHLGLHTIVFEGRPDVTLADKLVMVRYRHKFEEGWNLVPFEVADSAVAWKPGKISPETSAPFQWAGAANSPQLQADGSKRYIPQLVMGWVKRVLDRINPYEARYNDFFSNESPATYSSQIQIAGAPFAGKVALNSDKNVIENTGLIELYETVLARARELSIDNSSNGVASDGIQQALLLASTRLSVLYELLAREAYSDAQDPTITVSDAGDLTGVTSFTHAFQNIEADLQHEELALLRGTDFLKSYPVYNRMFWNYTKGLGEAAYNVNYNIYDENTDGFINEDDARALYPQGHGDAWGHFGSAIGMSYTLLQHPGFSWQSRSELYSLMQNVLEVDFLDEKTFAKLAAGRARTGRDIVRGTYRLAYTQDPDGQWQGYTDASDPARAWGVSGWAHRTGQSAYFDWLVANALLPDSADLDPSSPVEDPENLDLIERSAAVAEIGEIAGGLHEIQVVMDEANGGMNPLGFDDEALTFDLNMEFYENASGGDRRSHFEQIHGRAIVAANNALATLNFATQAENKLRAIADDTDALIVEALSQDLDYRNRLIEIFGRPYDGTIGFGKAYPEGYEGPDTQLFSYLDRTKISEIVPSGDPAGTPSSTVTFSSVNTRALAVMDDADMVGLYKDVFGDTTGTTNRKAAFETLIGDNNYLFETLDPDGTGPKSAPPLTHSYNTASKFGFQAPADWGQRTSYGRVQTALEQMLAVEIELDQALIDYIGFLQDWEAKARRLSSELDIYEKREGTTDTIEQIRIAVNAVILAADTAIGIAQAIYDVVDGISSTAAIAAPTAVGFSVDVGAIARAIGLASESAAGGVFNALKNAKEIVQKIAEFGRDEAIAQLERDFARLDAISGLEGQVEELVNLSGSDQPKRDTIGLLLQNLEMHRQEYFTAQAEGFRLLREREAFNKILAAKVQKNRYNDMIFRLSRNEAMTKYQTAFNHAARYTWLAARAYDYETSFDPGDPAAPGAFLDQIVKERQLGMWVDGEPRAGQGGLAEILYQMGANFEVLKGQLGINNPQVDFEKMSLRHELFRIGPPAADGGTPASDDRWREALKARIVPDLTQMPEFVRYCRPFAEAGEGPQPGIVIRFGSHINNGVNFFGNVLAPGDHAYSTANYANKIRGFGLWMENYNEAGLSTTPRAYLVPVGTDFLRTSSTEHASIRKWNIVEQRVPTPFVINPGNISAPGYIPTLGGVDGGFGQRRRHGDFRVFHDDGDDTATDDELQLTTRLISRSVWNSDWMLVIPGAGLDADPMTGLKKLALTIEDIRLQFSTYSHQGQ